MATWPLIYWVAVSFVGFVAALGSLTIALRWGRYLRKNRPELVGTFRLDLVRDWLLMSGLGSNLLAGCLAASNIWWQSSLRGFLTLVCLLVGVTVWTAYALLNFGLRTR